MLLHTLNPHLVAAHEALSRYGLNTDAIWRLLVIAQTMAKSPAQLKPPEPITIPNVRLAPARPADLPPTYFRMNEHISLVEVAPDLLTLLEVDDPHDLLGSNWEQFLDPQELKGLLEQWMVVAQNKGGFVHRFRFKTPTGRVLWLRERVYPLRDSSTLQFHGWFGYVEVVSKVLKMEEPYPTRVGTDSQQSA